jgi:hypothetical protein
VQPSAPGAALVQAEVTIAELAAYNRYLQYVALTSSGATRPTQADMAQYFSNGAAATTVPSSGQASSYYANGAEATRVPAPAPSVQPAQPSPSYQASPPPAAAPPAPYWWVEGTTPASSPEPPPAPSPPPPAAEPEARPLEAMSFEEWLRSMGANVQEAAASESIPALASGEVEMAPIAEPSARVVEVYERASYVVREKPRAHAAAATDSSGRLSALIGTFAAGLLLGALVMMRPRFRFHAE